MKKNIYFSSCWAYSYSIYLAARSDKIGLMQYRLINGCINKDDIITINTSARIILILRTNFSDLQAKIEWNLTDTVTVNWS